MHQRWRWILSLAFIVLFLASWASWGGPWLRALAFGLGLGIVIIQLSERRRRKAAELSTLKP